MDQTEFAGESSFGSADLKSESIVILSRSGFEIITNELAALRGEVADLKQMLANHIIDQQEPIQMREVDEDVARQEVRAAFAVAGDSTVWPDELADELALPLEQVLRICKELIAEGKVGIDGRV